MLKRQRLILALLREIDAPLTPTVFVKLMFLMRQSDPLGTDSPFYDFVPYKFGPFSFALYRELAALRRDGYVNPDETSVTFSPKNAQLVDDAISRLTPPQRSAVKSVVREHGGTAQRTLIKNIYRNHPWYATRSELTDCQPAQLPARPKADPAVYTVGYEGKSIDSFFDGLMQSGIQCLVDVRANPVSRKYGFAGRSLRDIAAKLGLHYQHMPELGIESGDRTTLNSFEDYQVLLDRYETSMLPTQPVAVRRLSELLHTMPSALMCVERDVRCCHRSRLAKAAAQESELPIFHI
ncbi:MAG TPA: DUF488 family protein [Pirellulales bacterium]|jgi:uncharacterized protein (DUF488 family)